MEDLWNLKELTELIKAQESDVDYPLGLIRSVDRAIHIFMYHFFEAREMLKKIEPSNTREALKLIFPSEEKKEHVWMNLAIQAHIQAGMYSARAIYDLFAQLVLEILLSKSIKVKDCTIKKIHKALPRSRLKSCLDDLLGGKEFKYVDAFVNTIKHRELVGFGPLASLESEKCGFQFRAFHFNEDSFSALWAKEVLEYALTTKNAVIVAGQLLNKEYRVYGGHHDK
jgi:hypothetical protein